VRIAATLAILCALLVPATAGAVNPDEVLSDPVLESRARELSRDIRCLVCQNQSIDDSNAGLARDLRIIVRERLVAGDSNQQVLDYLVDRYGDFVLLDPPMKSTTWLLWFAPVIVLGLGGIATVTYLMGRRRPEDVAAPLSEDERAELDRLMVSSSGGPAENPDGRRS
jgi:cytochrome c-type biogenesis protein CcmH